MLLDITAEEHSKNAELKTEIERKNFTRAVHLAESLNLDDEEVDNLRYKALCQMAETYRNTHGTKSLAQKYGYSKQEVKQILEDHASRVSEDGSGKPLKIRYDSSSGKYLTFEDWIIRFIEKWHKF